MTLLDFIVIFAALQNPDFAAYYPKIRIRC